MDESTDTTQKIREFLTRISFNHLLGLELVRVHRDGVTIQCKVRKELLNSTGAVHGGVTASVADAAAGSAIHHHFHGSRAATTVELKINYFRPVTEGRLLARCHLLRVGKTLCVGRVDLADGQRRPVGVAIVTYMFLDARKASS